MENRVKALEKSISLLAKNVHEIKRVLMDGFVVIDGNFKKINSDLSDINKKINKMDGNTSKSLRKVDGKLDNLNKEIKNIGKVTGYDEMLSNLKVVAKK